MGDDDGGSKVAGQLYECAVPLHRLSRLMTAASASLGYLGKEQMQCVQCGPYWISCHILMGSRSLFLHTCKGIFTLDWNVYLDLVLFCL